MSDLAKMGKSFLQAIIKSETSAENAFEVKKLVQNLIDGVIEKEAFSTELYKLGKEGQANKMNIFYFVEKILPHLRQALISGEMTIEGIRPPPVNASMRHPILTIETRTPGPILATAIDGTVGSAGANSASSQEPPTKRQKNTEGDDVLAAPTPDLQNLRSRPVQLSLPALIGQLVTATIENLNAEDRQLFISELFSLLAKYTASAVGPSAA